MSDTKTCARCDTEIQPILGRPLGARDTWWRNLIVMRRREVTHVLRLRVFRRRWLPENPRDQVSETYTELNLCDPCVRAVFAFAQTRPAPEAVTDRG